MDEQEQQRRRITEYGAALLVWLDNLPTEAHPNRGDTELRRRAEAELERLRALRKNPHPSHEERGGGWRA
jgi:hypothetical protein